MENETRKEMKETQKRKVEKRRERETTGELTRASSFTKQRGLRKAPCLGFKCL
jgi:hypothetical protein